MLLIEGNFLDSYFEKGNRPHPGQVINSFIFLKYILLLLFEFLYFKKRYIYKEINTKS
jgi:hypothetical protein